MKKKSTSSSRGVKNAVSTKRVTINSLRKLLEAEQVRLAGRRVIREDFSVNADDRYDEVDQATTDVEQWNVMRQSNRETFMLKKIEGALKRIEVGTYDECEDCGHSIGLQRLEARPFTTFCISCKEEQERGELKTAASLQHKSNGEGFSRRTA